LIIPARWPTAWVAAAAAVEVPTAACLIGNPSFFTQLLFGERMTAPGEALARISGAALLALAIACCPRGSAAEAGLPLLQGLLFLSAFAAGFLAYIGLTGGAAGVLLWPAAGAHFFLACMLVLTWSRAHRSRPPTFKETSAP
jgi:hypothetical protein